MSDATVSQVKGLLEKLSLSEKAEIVEWLEAAIKSDTPTTQQTQRRPMYGLCADLGPGPSDEDIEVVRREMWRNFPRDDF